MRFHIVGAGAIGGITGAFLIRQGEDVQFVDVVPEHVEALNTRGLFVDGVAGDFRVPARASLPQDLTETLDVVLLAVKSQHTLVALDGIESRLGPDSLVVSLQNGLNPPRIAERIGAQRVAGAFINFDADYIAPGHIRYGGAGDYYLGRLDGPPDGRLRAIGEKFSKIMNAVLTDNIMGYLWSKECLGCVLTGTALVDAPVYEVLSAPENREPLTAAVREAMRVANACNIRLEPFDPFDPAAFLSADHTSVSTFYDQMVTRYKTRVKQYTGIWRDIKVRHRKTEVNWLLGEIVRQGAQLGIDAPVNRRMVEMIVEIEDGKREMGLENLVELQRVASHATM